MNTSNMEFLAKEKRRIETFLQSGQLSKARKIAERLCRKQKNDAECWFLLGAVCGQQREYSRAIECCARTVNLAPGVAVAHMNLGVALHGGGFLEEAIDSLLKSIDLQSNMTAAYRELGLIYNEKDDYVQSIKYLNEFVRMQPQDPPVWLMLGNLYEKQEDLVNAERCYRKSYELDPFYIAAGINLGNTLKALGKVEETELLYVKLLEINNNNADVMFNLAVLLQSQFKYDEAKRYYKKIVDIQPDNNDVKQNLGNIYLALFRYEDAINTFLNIIENDVNNIDARRSLSAAYKEINAYEEAKEQLEIILSYAPDDIKTHQDMSLILLKRGDFFNGWQLYEWRSKDTPGTVSKLPLPDWQVTDSPDNTVLVYPEQGIGDEIMFSSCLADLSEEANVVLACDNRLKPLFKRSFPSIHVIGSLDSDGENHMERLPHIDSQISIASLPLHFRNKREYFSSGSYLIADDFCIEKWRDRYSKIDSKLTVGISWRGGHETNTLNKRSIELCQWEKLFKLSNVSFVNLQYGDCTSELNAIKQTMGITIYDWPDSDPLLELDDFAAKIKALDLVISIDNSTVHLSGALGVPTWILQPYSSDWRWFQNETGSCWYSSVKQYNQTRPGDWSTVVDDVVKNTLELLKSY